MRLVTVRWRQALVILSLVAAGGVLVSCGLPWIGSMFAGGLVALALVVGALSATALSGCGGRGTPGSLDTRVGPCLSRDIGITPCLTAIPQEGRKDFRVGPCLGTPAYDQRSGPDLRIGPCLDVIPADMKVGPCLKMMPPDSKVGPCLDVPLGDASARLDDATDRGPGREAMIERLLASGVISDELAARMRRLRG